VWHIIIRRWAFWWERCEMARRLTLVGVFVVIEQGSMLQLMIGTGFCASYILIQMQVSPFESRLTQYTHPPPPASSALF
jgi:hypothetical protein